MSQKPILGQGVYKTSIRPCFIYLLLVSECVARLTSMAYTLLVQQATSAETVIISVVHTVYQESRKFRENHFSGFLGTTNVGRLYRQQRMPPPPPKFSGENLQPQTHKIHLPQSFLLLYTCTTFSCGGI